MYVLMRLEGFVGVGEIGSMCQCLCDWKEV